MKKVIDINIYESEELRKWLDTHNPSISEQLFDRHPRFSLHIDLESWYWLYEFCPLRWLIDKINDQITVGEIFLLDKLDKLNQKYEKLSDSLEQSSRPISSE